jgi:hypothetical protein
MKPDGHVDAIVLHIAGPWALPGWTGHPGHSCLMDKKKEPTQHSTLSATSKPEPSKGERYTSA